MYIHDKLISKAYLGSLPLNSKNAYIGNYKMIDGDEPVEEWTGFKITSLEDANDITINVALNTGTSSKIYALYTSLDEGQNWTTEFDTQQNKTITYTLNTGDTLCIKADANRWQYASSNKGSSIKSTKTVNVSGNIMSLIYNDDFVDKTTFKDNADTYTFGYLLSGAKVVDAGKLILSATTLASSCYRYMFNGCSSLTTAPALPATTLADYCYANMFNGCSSLTTAPELPATTLASSCYQYMFKGCSSLTTAPELPATTLANFCYQYMFSGCSDLSTAPELPATTLANFCYQYMFSGCSDLSTAPELPATALANNCYQYMFLNCSNLSTAPELPATALVDKCYQYMFLNCSNLSEVTTYITSSWNTTYAYQWLSGVAPTGTLYNLGGATDIPTDNASGCPTGWTIKTTKP